MFGFSDDVVSPLLYSPPQGFVFHTELSPVDFGSGPFLDSPFAREDAALLAADIAPFADVLSAFESAGQEEPRLRPFASFEATEIAVSRLRALLK
jgi:hypothetical protein